ncbi:hypothetical protein AB0O57_29595 [Streptomyces sp. NPDC091201]|uniref:hypothetical protein n=1 Tax=Streptomyces sp. NPDC091201 TaxID=3155190 RepID=UPI00343D28F9
MAEVVIPRKSESQKRADRAEALANLGGGSARRGEDDDSNGSKKVVEAVVVSTPSDVAPPFAYIPAPADANPLEHLAHAERQIKGHMETAGDALLKTQRDFMVVAGRWLSEVQREKSYKAAGYKNVNAFADSLGIKGKDYYRIIDAYLVYTALGDLVETPLPVLVIEQLASTARSSTGQVREQFAVMKREGQITPDGAKAAKALLTLGAAQPVRELKAAPEVSARLQAARKAGRIDLDLVKEVAASDPGEAKVYVDGLRELVEEAEKLLANE